MANINDLKNSIVLFVMIGILLGIGIVVFTQFGNSMQTTSTVGNERITSLLNKDVALANTRIASFNAAILNTNGSVVPSENYVVTLDPASFRLTTAGLLANNTLVNVSYVSYVNTPTSIVMSSMTDVFSPISTTWIPLIITVLMLAIVLGIVISSFGNRR